MAERNTEALGTAFTVSIDAERRFGVTTGISAADRAATIHVAINPRHRPGDLRRPGPHLPAAGPARRRAAAGGPDRGERGPGPAGRAGPGRRDLRDPQRRRHHGAAPGAGGVRRASTRLTFITVAQLVAYRLQTERLVHRVAEARLPTEFGEFRIIGYRNDVDRRRARGAGATARSRDSPTSWCGCTPSA